VRALVVGWFSFPYMGATAGDLLARDTVCEWLDDIGAAYDVAGTEQFGGLDVEGANPQRYSHVVFVCGPLGNGTPVTELFERFAHARVVGVDVSMLQDLAEWNPFHLLLERDSSRTARPDVTFAAPSAPVPVVGLVLVHEQKEYVGAMHAHVHEQIRAALGSVQAAVVEIDTGLDPPNTTGLRSADQIESLIARMDAVVTTRLHGLVLAIKHGVPALAIDPIRGGAKIARQAAAIGWPIALVAEEATEAAIREGLRTCLTADARSSAHAAADRARNAVSAIEEAFRAEFRSAATDR